MLLKYLIKNRPNHNGDMSIKQRNETINNHYVRNRNTKSPFEKKNEEIKNIILTTKQLFLKDKNKNVKNVSNDSVTKIPNNVRYITDKYIVSLKIDTKVYLMWFHQLRVISNLKDVLKSLRRHLQNQTTY